MLSLTASLTVVIIGGTALALWWLLRGVPAWVHGVLWLCVVGALAARILFITDYPSGFNTDEPEHFWSSVAARRADAPLVPGIKGYCVLFSALFSAPFVSLIPTIGSRFVLRGYSIVFGALGVVAAYTCGRALQLGSAASLTGAALIAVLPWSLFYSRWTVGGEMIFYVLLLGTALARLVCDDRAGWRAGAIGALALALLLYAYWNGLAMVGWAAAALVLMRRWRPRLWGVALIALALCAWYPWWRVSPLQRTLIGSVTGFVSGQPATRVPATWNLTPGLADPIVAAYRVLMVLRCLVQPVAEWSIWTQPAVLMHPWPVLVAALVGCVGSGWRRGALLASGFVFGVAPGLVSDQPSVSGHRVLLGLPFLAIAAAAGIACIPWPRVRVAGALALVCVAAAWSLPFFFSAAFWPEFTYAWPYTYEVRPSR